MSEHDDSSTGGDHGPAGEEECKATFEPVVQLKAVEVDTGEKHEDCIYKQRCALMRFDASAEPAMWKERGKGDVKFLKHKETGLVRVILRQEKTLKLCMNHIVNPRVELRSNPSSDKFWAWRTEDFAGEAPITETFGIKFKTPDIANEYKKVWDDSAKANDAILAKKAGDGSAAAAAPAGKAADAPKADAAKAAAPAVAAAPAAAAKKDAEPDLVWTKIIAERKYNPLAESDVKKVWDSFDKNKDGKIDRKELTKVLEGLLTAVLASLQVPASEDLTKRMNDELPTLVNRALARLDVNHDGFLTWDEFKNLNEVRMIQN